MQERDSRLGSPFSLRLALLVRRPPGAWQDGPPFFFDAFRSRSAPLRCMCRLIGNMVYCATWWRGCSASTLAGGGALVCMRGFQRTVCAGRYLLPSVVSPCFLAMVLILRWDGRRFPFPSLIRRRMFAGIVSFGKPRRKAILPEAVRVLQDE